MLQWSFPASPMYHGTSDLLFLGFPMEECALVNAVRSYNPTTIHSPYATSEYYSY